MVWPSGVNIVPLFVTLGPIRATRPPTLALLAGEVICAPGSTMTSPSAPFGSREAGGVNAGEQKLVVGIVQQPAIDQVHVDGKRGGDEGVDVDLGGAAEDDAVLVDDVDLAAGFDGTEDLGRGNGVALDDVEGDPLALDRAAGGLVEIKGGFCTDVE
jgi:hypothetical protein